MTAREEHSQQKPTYVDCLMGRAVVPSDKLGFFVFQMLMVGGMVSVMATFNGVRHSGLDFFATSHWFYPIVFCSAFVIRRTVGNAITDRLIPRLVTPYLTGAAGAIAKTAINVGVMCPMVSLVVSILLEGWGFAAFYITAVPVSLPVAILVNYLLVGPVVKMVYARFAAQGGNERLLAILSRYAPGLTAMFGC